MYRHRTLLKKLSTLPLITETGPWSRAVAFKHLTGPPPGAPFGSPPRLLWPGGAKAHGQRFTPKGGFDTAYLASDAVAAMKEVSAVLMGPAGPIPLAARPFVVVSVKGLVNNVLDTTDPAVLDALGTSVSELTGAWAFVPRGGLAPTQVLGRAAYNSRRVHGIKYHSAKSTGEGTCLAVFPDRMITPREGVAIFDPHGNLLDSLP